MMQAAADGASRADDAAASQHLREHAERSGRAFGSERLTVRLIDYEVTPSQARDCARSDWSHDKADATCHAMQHN